MSGFVRDCLSSIPVDQQWMRYLEDQTTSGGFSQAERQTLVAHRDSQETRTSIFQSVSLVWSSLLFGLDASSARVDRSIARQTETLDSRLYQVQEAFSEVLSSLQDSLESGMDQLEGILRDRFEAGAEQLSGLSDTATGWSRRMDRNQRMHIHPHRLGNTHSLNIAELMLIPDIQKERQDNLEKNLTQFKNGVVDPEHNEHAQERLAAALAIEKTDYVALFHLGLIHMYTLQFLDLALAGECLKKAGKFATIDSDPRAARLFDILSGDPSRPLREKSTDLGAVKRLAGDAYALAAQSFYLRGMNEQALELLGRSLALTPHSRETRFWKVRVLCLLDRSRDAIPDLQSLIVEDAGFCLQAAVDPDLAGSFEIHSLLAQLCDEENEKLRLFIEKNSILLAPRSGVKEVMEKLRSLLAKNSYLDAHEGLKLIETTKFVLDGISLGLQNFLEREHEILTEQLPETLSLVRGFSPKSQEGTELRKRLLGLLEGGSAQDCCDAKKMLEKSVTADKLAVLFGRSAVGSDFHKVLLELKSMDESESGKVGIVLPSIGVQDSTRVSSMTKRIYGTLPEIITDLYQWLDGVEKTWNDIGKAKNNVIRIENEAAQRKNEAENIVWRESLQSSHAKLWALKERESDLGREIRNSSSFKNLFGIMRYQESDQHMLVYLGSTIREVEKKIATIERRRPVALVPEQVQALQPTPALQTGDGMVLFREIITVPVEVPVEGGTFAMASENEKAVHHVTLSDFYIGKYQVTQEEYSAVIGSNPSAFATGSDAQRRPVEQVSWYDAVAFCNQLSEKETLARVYTISGTSVTADFSRNGYRLPTEAEWEYAARGGKHSRGHRYSGSNDTVQVAWYEANSRKTTHAVGTKAANELGLYDMSGNVWEWCNDWYDFGSYGISQGDPMGASSGSNRVKRGGSWVNNADVCRSTFRNRGNPEFRCYLNGFRVVRRP